MNPKNKKKIAQRNGIILAGSYSAGKACNIEEKSLKPKSSCTVTGLYFHGSRVVDIAKPVKPRTRGELAVTAINLAYLKLVQFSVLIMRRGYAWLVEYRQGLKIACPEDLARRSGFIISEQLEKLARPLARNGYGQYLKRLQAEGLPS